jgi:hypothetical protein
MAEPVSKTQAQHVADFVLRVVTATPELTYFGANSAGYGLAEAVAGQAAEDEALARSTRRRFTLLGSEGDDTTAVAEEHGAHRRGEARAIVLLILRPWTATVTAIGAGSRIAVDDASKFAASDSIRIRSEDGSETEVLTILSISTGTGPDGEDELVCTAMTHTYSPGTEEVRVLLRRTLTAGTVLRSTSGIRFETLEDVTVGDANPVFDGESEALSLADKVRAEAQEPGVAGNVDAFSVAELESADADIRAIVQPERGYGGSDEESDFGLKFRAAHAGQAAAAETPAWYEARGQHYDRDVLRVFVDAPAAVSTTTLRALTRQGGGLSVDRRAALSAYLQQRVRAALQIEVLNATPTAVEVEADITLTPGPGTPRQRLIAVWRRVADRIATFIDYRKWKPGQFVDEAALIAIVQETPGVASVKSESFVPATDITVSDTSVPVFVRLYLRDLGSGQIYGVSLAQVYG